MTRVLEATPASVQADLIDRVLAQAHPKLAIPTIAANAHLSLVDLQTLLNYHGYPDKAQLARARDRLRAKPAARGTTSTAPAEISTGESLIEVAVTRLRPDPDNPRIDGHDDAIVELADSIAEVGLLQPIVVRRDPPGSHLVIVAGHRRYAAVQHLGWKRVQVILRDQMRPDHVLAAMLIENGHRRDLDPVEEARGLLRLKTQTDCSDGELARKVGRSHPYVSGRLALLALTPEQQAEIRAGDMSLTEATHKGRLAAGTVRTKGVERGWHLGPHHELADRAKARCKRLGHSRARTVGGMACGECWESVIRADERTSLHQRSADTGTCSLCGTPDTGVEIREVAG